MSIDLKSFIYKNITPYEGDASFLVWPTEKTKKVWEACKVALQKERDNGGCLDVDVENIATITSHKPWYIDKDNEVIFGLQTDELLKRAIKPFGGIRLVEKAVEEKGKTLDPKVIEIFKYAKNHNDAVFDAYDEEIRKFRSNHLVTGLPDNYARGRIIWDYRRLALYGTDYLIQEKELFNFKK